MKGLIAERPNLVPAGLGNNVSGVDVSVLLPNAAATDSEPDSTFYPDNVYDYDMDAHMESTGGIDPDSDAADAANTTTSESQLIPGIETDSDEEKLDEEDVTPIVTGKKVKPPTKHTDKKKTPAKPATSTPAKIKDERKPAKKPKNPAERFTEIALKEEETAQRMFEVKKQRNEGINEREIAKINAKLQARMHKEKLKAELVAKRMEHEFRLKMMQFNGGQGQGHGATFNGYSSEHSGPTWPAAGSSLSTGTSTGTSTPYSFMADLNDPDLSTFIDGSGQQRNM